MFKFEQDSNQEKEKNLETKIFLDFFRHGIKEVDPNKSSSELMLSEVGKREAHEKGKKINSQPEVSLAWGGPQKRTQETSAHVMLANEAEIGEIDTLEEMEDKMKNNMKVGKRVIEDDRLNFTYSGPVGDALKAEFANNPQFMLKYVKDSDQMAIDGKDQISTTYSRQAGNLAEIVDRYMKIGNNFNRLASKKDDYKKTGNQLERYLGSHGTVVESFLAKLIEKTLGKAARDNFLEKVGHCFKELEGIRVEIINKGVEQKIKIYYELDEEEKTLEVDINILQNIMNDRKKLDEKCK